MPKLISCTASRWDKASKVGLSLSSVPCTCCYLAKANAPRRSSAAPNKVVMISEVSQTGIFQDSALQVGMQIVSVNGVDCRGISSPSSVQRLLQNSVGEVTVKASRNLLCLRHDELKQEESLRKLEASVSFRKLTKDGSMRNTSLPKQLEHAKHTISTTPVREGDDVAIAASVTTTKTVTFPCGKMNGNDKLGISIDAHYSSSTSGSNKPSYIITHISEDSFFAGIGLQVGMELRRINGVECDSFDELAQLEAFLFDQPKVDLSIEVSSALPVSLQPSQVRKSSVMNGLMASKSTAEPSLNSCSTLHEPTSPSQKRRSFSMLPSALFFRKS